MSVHSSICISAGSGYIWMWSVQNIIFLFYFSKMKWQRPISYGFITLHKAFFIYWLAYIFSLEIEGRNVFFPLVLDETHFSFEIYIKNQARLICKHWGEEGEPECEQASFPMSASTLCARALFSMLLHLPFVTIFQRLRLSFRLVFRNTFFRIVFLMILVHWFCHR